MCPLKAVIAKWDNSPLLLPLKEQRETIHLHCPSFQTKGDHSSSLFLFYTKCAEDYWLLSATSPDATEQILTDALSHYLIALLFHLS
jgi:hypothetical protein